MSPNSLLLIIFFIVWTAMMVAAVYCWWHVAPTALQRWAEERGYRIFDRTTVGPPAWFFYAKGSGQRVYRIVVVDEAWQTQSGLVRVGKPYWFCLSPTRCPVEVLWDSAGEPVHTENIKSESNPLEDL
jgi:hypothetical protein